MTTRDRAYRAIESAMEKGLDVDRLEQDTERCYWAANTTRAAKRLRAILRILNPIEYRSSPLENRQ